MMFVVSFEVPVLTFHTFYSTDSLLEYDKVWIQRGHLTLLGDILRWFLVVPPEIAPLFLSISVVTTAYLKYSLATISGCWCCVAKWLARYTSTHFRRDRKRLQFAILHPKSIPGVYGFCNVHKARINNLSWHFRSLRKWKVRIVQPSSASEREYGHCTVRAFFFFQP